MGGNAQPSTRNRNVETQGLASLRNRRGNTFGPQTTNLASFVRGFKSAVTKYAKEQNISFAWQPRFHDHIIRNEKSLFALRNYIKYNPANWHLDVENPNYEKNSDGSYSK